MICEKCGKNNATTNIKTIINGVLCEKNLCSECAVSEGYGNIGKNSLTQLLASMFGDALSIDNNSKTKRCPCCNSSFSDIAEKGLAGCAKCYETFYEEILPYLKRVHGSTKHTGKIPNRAPLAVTQTEDILGSLRMELNRLVNEENFEQAAIIRDKIRELEDK